jgi:hypothetical protein
MTGSESTPEFKPKDIKENLKLIAKHPIDFAKHVAGGELAGMGLGLAGGAFVTTPIAALMALKNHKFGNPGYWKSFKETMGTGLLAESTGMGVAGTIIGGNKFFGKYKSDAVKQAFYKCAVIDELEKIADIKLNDDQTFHPGRLGAVLGSSAGLQFGINNMWSEIGKAHGGKKMQKIIMHNIRTLPFKEKIKFMGKLSKEFAKPALIGLAAGAFLGEAAGKSLERAAISNKNDKKFSLKDWAFKKKAEAKKGDEDIKKDIKKGSVAGAAIGAAAIGVPLGLAFLNKGMYHRLEKTPPLSRRIVNALTTGTIGATMGAPIGFVAGGSIGAGTNVTVKAAKEVPGIVTDAAEGVKNKIEDIKNKIEDIQHKN